MPLIGTIIDGAEDWIKSYNNSHKQKIDIPLFNNEEQSFYEKMRLSIKLWENDYEQIRKKLEIFYDESDEYFSNLCRPIIKYLKLYDIFGVDIVNGEYCGNTILCASYVPNYKYGYEYGTRLQKLSEFGGGYIALFDAMEEYTVNHDMKFSVRDYGGLIKSPVGNQFSDKFVLFSLVCQIQFILVCVN